jgi:hypothetical protein
MIKFRGTDKNDVPVVGFGLSEANVQRLKQGMPILIDTDDTKELFGVPAQIVIFYGNTEESMQEELRATGLGFPEARQEPPK